MRARTQLTLQEFSADLQSLSEQMMKRVENENKNEDVECCMNLLYSVTLAFRSLSLKKLAIFADLSTSFQDEKFINDLVN